MPSGKQRGRREPQLRLAGLGIELVGAILGFTLLGLWIDHHFDSRPWGLLVCVVMGFVGGFYNLIRASLKAMGRDSHDSRSKGRDPSRPEQD